MERLALPPKHSDDIRSVVRNRARFLCEYCHTDERWQVVQFTVDHVVPVSDGGTDALENLALACFHCNRRKSKTQIVADSPTGRSISIYNPRTMVWSEHFSWSPDKLRIIPKTEIGRLTVDLLHLNRDRILQIRQDDKMVNRHPPAMD